MEPFEVGFLGYMSRSAKPGARRYLRDRDLQRKISAGLTDSGGPQDVPGHRPLKAGVLAPDAWP